MKIIMKLVIGFITFSSLFILITYLYEPVRFSVQEQFIGLDEKSQDSIKKIVGNNYFIHSHKTANSFMISNHDESPLRIIRDVFTWKKIDSSTSFVIEGTDSSTIKYIFFLKDKESYSYWSQNETFKKICFGELNGKRFKIDDQVIFILELGYVVSFIFESEVVSQENMLLSLLNCKQKESISGKVYINSRKALSVRSNALLKYTTIQLL